MITDAIFHAAVQDLIRRAGGNPNRVTRDHASDARFDGKTPKQLAEKELKRQKLAQ